MNNNENSVKPHIDIASCQSLISFLKNSEDSWCIKNKEAEYVFVNDIATRFFKFPKKFNPEGKSDKEVPTEICQELWPQFMEIDNKVIEEDKKITSITIHYYGKGNSDNPVPYLSEQSPFYNDDNKIVGIICHGRPLAVPTLLYYMDKLNRNTIQIDKPNDIFTRKELEIIFWAQQRLSAKEIARRLDLSPKTVLARLQIIYEKAQVHSTIQLIEYCKHAGLDSYIPSDFIRKGIQLI